jgi:hypothetical protein
MRMERTLMHGCVSLRVSPGAAFAPADGIRVIGEETIGPT